MKEYTRNNPFLASIKERYSLCKSGFGKETQHIVLDLKGADAHYNVGDSVAIFPDNDPVLVEHTLKVIGATGNEIINDKRTGEKLELRTFLTKKAGITEFSKKFVTELAKKQTNNEKREKLEEILNHSFKEYQANRELWDALSENAEVKFDLQELCDLLMPLMARFYSISSSKNVVGDEVHLTVALLSYKTNEQLRRGVCTHFLCNLVPLHEPVVPIYFQSGNEFTVPKTLVLLSSWWGPEQGLPLSAPLCKKELELIAGKIGCFSVNGSGSITFSMRIFGVSLKVVAI